MFIYVHDPPTYSRGACVTAVRQVPFVLSFEHQKSAALRFWPLWQEALFFEPLGQKKQIVWKQKKVLLVSIKSVTNI